MAVPMASSAKVAALIHFDGSKHRVASFRMGGVALRDIQTRFISEVGLCRPTLLRRFQKMSCSFSGRRSA